MIYRIGIAAMTIAAFDAAQNSGGPFPPAYRGVQTRVSGVFVTPVAGVPFSAFVVIDSTQTLPNGSANAVHSSAHIARDSQGRIYNEASAMLPAAFSGT